MSITDLETGILAIHPDLTEALSIFQKKSCHLRIYCSGFQSPIHIILDGLSESDKIQELNGKQANSIPTKHVNGKIGMFLNIIPSDQFTIQ